MSIALIILLAVVGIIVLLLIAGLFMRKEHYVKRSILVQAPRQQVFDFLKLLSNQEKFNKWARTDPGRIEEFKGTDGTVGYIYSWRGNKSAGEGQKEIKGLIEGKRIETEIRFVKPMATSATVIMEMESPADDETKVYLSNGGTLNYPLNILIPVFEKMFARQMDSSLLTLKSILENKERAVQ